MAITKRYEKVDDFIELRVGTPVRYTESPSNEIYSGRVEAVGWDWAVIREVTLDGESFIFCCVDCNEIEIEYITTTEDVVKEIPVNVKGIGVI